MSKLPLLYLLSILGSIRAAPIAENFYHDHANTVSIDWEYGDKFEGDMVLTVAQSRLVGNAWEDQRNGLRNLTKLWPGNEVVYNIHDDDFDEKEVLMIEEAINDISNKSCIKFRKRNSEDEHAVTIQGKAGGCFSNVGFNDDAEDSQTLNLAKGCFKHGTIVHEMLHTLGFYHMQSTHDRDDYIKVVWENIKHGMEHNFYKYDNDTVTDFGVPYDYASVMHYGETAFTKNGNKTILPLQEGAVIGQRDAMSEKDILKLNRMYCNGFTDNKINVQGFYLRFSHILLS